MKTLAVMPTLVAQSCADECMRESMFVGYQIRRNTPAEQNGAITPRTATSNDDQPTSIISFKSDSSPTSNSRIMTPELRERRHCLVRL